MSRGATVLVVDDDRDIVDAMAEILAAEGHRVLVAMNGRDALEIARGERPDLVLLDLEMPEMDGRAFLAAVGGVPALCGVPIVVVSGAEDACDLPAAACLSKPVRLDGLLALIDRAAHAAR